MRKKDLFGLDMDLGFGFSSKKAKKRYQGLLKPFGDIDRDGVKNIFDCRPLDFRRQDIMPNKAQRERMWLLPIFVADETPGRKNRFISDFESPETIKRYHVLSKQARKHAPESRRYALSVMKRYPNIIGVMEKEKPPLLLFSTTRLASDAAGFVKPHTRSTVIHHPLKYTATSEEAVDYMKQKLHLYHQPERQTKAQKFFVDSFADEPTEIVDRKKRKRMAWTTFHELQHIRQLNEAKSTNEYLVNYMKSEKIAEKIPGTMNIYETQADLAAMEHIREREPIVDPKVRKYYKKYKHIRDVMDDEEEEEDIVEGTEEFFEDVDDMEET